MLIGKPKPKPVSQFPNSVVLPLPKFKPKQRIAWDSKATQILLGGDTRAGKSFFVKKAYIRFAAEIPGLVLDIFRLNWDDVIKNYMKGEWSFPVIMARWIDAKLCTVTQQSWRLWNDSECNLYHCSDDIVLQKHQGNPTHVRTVEEACQIPERRIRSLIGWMDMSNEMKERVPEKWKGCFPRMYFPTNCMGPSAGYFDRNFVEPRPEFAIEQVGAFTKQYIPFELIDNDSVNPDIVTARVKESFPDPAMQRALLARDWKAKTGLYFTEWNEDRHVCPDFVIPDHWYRYRSFDWSSGSLGGDPAYVGWFAISDGYPWKDRNDGKERWFPRGALILHNEWYICDDGHADPQYNRFDKGRSISNEEMAYGILERDELGHSDLITLSDGKPFQNVGGKVIDGTKEGPAKTFLDCGVPLSKSDTGPGSRLVGWSAMRGRLIGSPLKSGVLDQFGRPIKIPGLFVFASCKFARDYIPQLPRNPKETKGDDAAEHGEPTHTCDTIKNACVAHNDAVIKDYLMPFDMQIAVGLEKMAQQSKRGRTINGIMAEQGFDDL